MLRVGLLGLGYWGPDYGRVLSELPDADLVWACDVQPEKLEVIRARDRTITLTTTHAGGSPVAVPQLAAAAG